MSTLSPEDQKTNLKVEEEIQPTGDGARLLNSKQGFTRGPWEYRNGYVYHRNASDRAGRTKSYPICGVSLPGANEMLAATGEYGTSGESKAIRDANGHLLAAAPTLYDALRNLGEYAAALEMMLNKEVEGAQLKEARAALSLVDSPVKETAAEHRKMGHDSGVIGSQS